MASKKQIILPLAVLTVGITAAVALTAMKEPPEEKVEEIIHPLVKVDPIELSPIRLNVSSYGIVQPKYSTDLVAQVSGQIIELSAQFVKGGFVKEGEILARIDPNDYEAALIEAEASLAQASSALEIEQAQAQVAKVEWQRIKDDSSEKIPSELYLRKPQLAEKLARYRAAQAAVKRAKRNLERTYIKAPYDAIVKNREISLGSVVNPGNSFGQLSAVSVAEIRLPVADKELQYLPNYGKHVPVTLSAEVAGQQVSWKGEIVRSEGVIDQQSRMTYLVAQIEQPYGDTNKPLRFGAYANAEIQGRLVENAAMIPQHLVKNQKVATLDRDNKLVYQQLNVIREYNGFVIADQGINSGQQLITSALEYPTEGMQLRTDDAQLKTDSTQLALKEE
ncbi:efflux RND transporter periplasmic adaptor subunit [Pseudoalteromonas sp. T1lg65]|uniref:efflux RND transporter periplasmic adaptor subunit n=1 Tax=Pseudoalteromonas sp. T1lg65 TaxID=2077101 RepID=UPI003F7A38CC